MACYFFVKTHNITAYALKACREKVRREAGPIKEGGGGAASRERENLGFCLVFT